MSTANPDSTTTTKGKRTNSLAFAQTDCHTCASSGEHCDRRRPKCSTCLRQGRRCDGFVTPLSWDPRRMKTDDSAVHPLSADPFIMSNSTPPQRFQFVTGARVRKRRRTGPATARARPARRSATPEALPREAGEQAAGGLSLRPDPTGTTLIDPGTHCQRRVALFVCLEKDTDRSRSYTVRLRDPRRTMSGRFQHLRILDAGYLRVDPTTPCPD